MTLQQLRYVIEVSNSKSLSKAAKNLFISQPSLTNALKELEKELSIKIFIRSNRGMNITNEGREFLGYAQQVINQSDLLSERYSNKGLRKQKFSLSAQHYSFVVNAFVDLLKKYDANEFDFTIRETKTMEIITDVKSYRSEIGVLYYDSYNKDIILKELKANQMEKIELFTSTPHVFISKDNPLASKEIIELTDLEEYPFLSFDQGINNSFYFSEEMFSYVPHKRIIKVTDRATLFNLLIGLSGYTISSGIIDEKLNGTNIKSIPLNLNEEMHIIVIYNKATPLSELALEYLDNLKKYTCI